MAAAVAAPATNSDHEVLRGGVWQLLDAADRDKASGRGAGDGVPAALVVVQSPADEEPYPDDPADPTAPPEPTEPPDDTAPPDQVQTGHTLFGSSLGLAAGGTVAGRLYSIDDELGQLPVVRIFNASLPAPWSQREMLRDRAIVVSFKARPRDVVAGLHDARLLDWFETAPGGRPVYWTYFHEPEDDIERGAFTAEEFRDAWRHLRELADEAGNPNLHATLVLMGWTVNLNSNRDWRDYYPGDDVIDVLGWDNYNWGHRNGRYASPEELYSRVIEVSDEIGKPWGIAETGTRLLPHDDGATRAEWLTIVGEYLADQGALWVTYFNSTVGGDYRLTDPSSQQAWHELVEASRP